MAATRQLGHRSAEIALGEQFSSGCSSTSGQRSRSMKSYCSRTHLRSPRAHPSPSDGLQVSNQHGRRNLRRRPGQTWANYPTPSNARQVFSFSAPVTARYVRWYVTQESKDAGQNFYAQIGEIFVTSPDPQALAPVPVAAATGSSQAGGFAAANAIDGDSATAWSSTEGTQASGASLTVDLGATRAAAAIQLVPRDQGSGFPVDFALQSSSDGAAWSTLPSQAYTGYANPGRLPRPSRFRPPCQPNTSGSRLPSEVQTPRDGTTPSSQNFVCLAFPHR